MYKSSYKHSVLHHDRNNIMSPQINLPREMIEPFNLDTSCGKNSIVTNSSQFTRSSDNDKFRSSEDVISIQHIANDDTNVSGYRLVNSTQCDWFGAGETGISWTTMYQTQFVNPKSSFVNGLKSPAQYRLEQIYRHMGNRSAILKLN